MAVRGLVIAERREQSRVGRVPIAGGVLVVLPLRPPTWPTEWWLG